MRFNTNRTVQHTHSPTKWIPQKTKSSYRSQSVTRVKIRRSTGADESVRDGVNLG
jgi:hypothetical protein